MRVVFWVIVMAMVIVMVSVKARAGAFMDLC
jgi:hypothetical protein